MKTNSNKTGIYIHIPFCKSKCNYCSFLSFSNSEAKFELYKNALIEEIKAHREQLGTSGESKIETIFFGGGTPTVFPPSFLCEVLEVLYKLNVNSNTEITIEANPDTVSYETLKVLRQNGVNRLSIGLQAWQNKHLKNLGRIHSAETFVNAYENAVKAGFSNINVDLMFSLPNQTIAQWSETLENVALLKPTHISTYSLSVEENTPFYTKGINALEEAIDREMYYFTRQFLSQFGYNRYEISNFAKESFECKHNKIYWKRQNYFGFGLGAHSFVNNIRYNNTENFEKYASGSGSNGIKENIIEIGLSEAIEEFIFLGLRLACGINTFEFYEAFKKDIFNIYGKQIKRLENLKLLEVDKNNIKLTDKGIDVSNTVFSEILNT